MRTWRSFSRVCWLSTSILRRSRSAASASSFA
uniref:Uncharacterized protein n=1 Tax=Arundo donax TaxID=35708 RepID=A0A0A9HE88_ARUDO